MPCARISVLVPRTNPPRPRAGFIMANILTRLLTMGESRQLRQFDAVVAAVNALEPEYSALTDAQLRDKTAEFKSRVADGEDLDDIAPEAFAACREGAKRAIG